MNCNFNLKHPSQRKLNMSPFLEPAGLKRCFSTSSSYNMNPNMSNKLNMDPFINFISGFDSRKIERSKSMPGRVSSFHCGSLGTAAGMSLNSMTASPFGSATMSVSCIVGGLVSDQPQQYCDDLLLDVFLNQFPSSNKKTTCETVPLREQVQSINIDKVTEPSPKRTYAEVTKEKPKPRNLPSPPQNCRISKPPTNCARPCSKPLDPIKKLVKNCDNVAVPVILSCQRPEKLTTDSPLKKETCILSQGSCLPRQKSSSTSSSESSAGEESTRVCRSLSECSIESDDSFIVFQTDDEQTLCDESLEESDDEEDDSQNKIPEKSPCLDTRPSPSPKQVKKKVQWARDSELVAIHPLIKWDFASRAARVGPWEQLARDRERFAKRIADTSEVISPILEPAHRTAVYAKRFATS